VKLRILPRARFDIDRLHQFLAPKDPAAANRMVDAVLEAMLTLKSAPEKGRRLSTGLRELIVPFGKGAYIVRYVVRKDEQRILITRIWHSRERRS
jgi:plasmid stabilization system protein ParE